MRFNFLKLTKKLTFSNSLVAGFKFSESSDVLSRKKVDVEFGYQRAHTFVEK